MKRIVARTVCSYYTLHIVTVVGHISTGTFVCHCLHADWSYMIKSDKWVEVPPQRLNLSLAPTSTKGLRAALTFNF